MPRLGRALQAFEKNPKDADTLANLAVASLHLGKNSSRYLGCAGGPGRRGQGPGEGPGGGGRGGMWACSVSGWGGSCGGGSRVRCFVRARCGQGVAVWALKFALPGHPGEGELCAGKAPAQWAPPVGCRQLKIVAPGHLLAKRYEAGEELFDRAASAVTA